jgi:adenosylcobinamide-phosphate synthase
MRSTDWAGVGPTGVNSYGSEVEDRGTLGDGLPPTVADIRRTASLARRVSYAAAAVAAILALRPKIGSRRKAGDVRLRRGGERECI